MVRCDLCGASPSGTDAEAEADAGASPSGTGAEAHRDASPAGANAHAGADAGDSDETVPLSWVVSVEAGRTRTYCEACAREHLRSIEAKLDSEWW
jgi:hypothetical protein